MFFIVLHEIRASAPDRPRRVNVAHITDYASKGPSLSPDDQDFDSGEEYDKAVKQWDRDNQPEQLAKGPTFVSIIGHGWEALLVREWISTIDNLIELCNGTVWKGEP